MLVKLSTFQGISPKGEPLVYLFDSPLYLEKVAGTIMPAVQQWKDEYCPTDDEFPILVNAMGASEYWGQNVNGDVFPESTLLHDCRNHPSDHHPIDDFNGKTIPPYGYWTFLNAHPFVHHKNKDPNRAFGRVALAVWNPKMHRVELVVVISKKLAMQHGAQHVIDRIMAGEFPDVSMGCVKAGTMILMANGRRKAVEYVIEGDNVFTHLGDSRRVISTMVRQYTDPAYRLKAYGHPEMVITGEHPLWLVRRDRVDCRPSSKSVNRGRKQHTCTPDSALTNKGCGGCTTIPDYKFDWVRADEAVEGDFLAQPVPKFITDLKLSNEQARLLGFYLAEGHVLRTKAGNVQGIQFSTGIEDTRFREDFERLVESLGLEENYSTYDVPERGGQYLSLWGVPELASLCLDHCGSGAATKSLSVDLMGQDTHTLKVFLGAYANGDGGTYKGSVYFSSCSSELANQIAQVALRCRMVPSVGEIHHKPSKLVPIETVEHRVWIGTDTSWKLDGFTYKPVSKSRKSNSKRFFFDKDGCSWLLTPIESIDEEEYDDKVYNFSVEGHESYVAEGLAVHNCRVPYDVCFPAGTLVRTDRGLRPIEEIKGGEYVFTHRSRYRAVETTSERQYEGVMVDLGIWGLPRNMIQTASHPIEVVREENIRACNGSANGLQRRHSPSADGICKTCKRLVCVSSEWVKASDVKAGDYLVHYRELGVAEDVVKCGVDMAYLAGLYLGDGHIIRQRSGRGKTGDKKSVGIGITFGHASKSIAERFEETCIRLLEAGELKNMPRFYEHRDRNADVANIYGIDIALRLEYLGGRGCKNKQFAAEVFQWNDSEKLSLLGGLIDSDGCQDKNGSMRVVGTNERLMLDTRRLLMSLGVAATVSSYISRSGFGEPCTVFQVSIPGSASSRFSDFSAKVRSINKKSGTAAIVLPDKVLAPVQSVEHYEDTLPVYNLQVEEDESYSVLDMSVHNCTICGNKSKTRHDYCSCINEFGMGKILDDGRRVGVVNTYPRFFDISFVFIGADKTAKFMCKLSSGIFVPQSVADGEDLYGITEDGEDLVKAASDMRDREAKNPIRNFINREKLHGPDAIREIIKVMKGGPVLENSFSRADTQGQETTDAIGDGALGTNSHRYESDSSKEASPRMAPIYKAALGMKLAPPPSPNRSEYPFVGSIDFRGLTIYVENAPGTWRTGKGWKTLMRVAYGEFSQSGGTDGDLLDVYVGPSRKCKNAYIVHQNFVRGPNKGKYDEDKVMLGFDTQEQAKQAYLDHYDSNKYFRSMTVMAFPLFKRAILGGEVDGEKVASYRESMEKISSDMKLEDLFSGKANQRVRIWKDLKGNKTVQEGPILTKKASAVQPFTSQELLKLASEPEKVAISKWADIVKEIGPSKAVGKVSSLLSDAEPSMPDDVRNDMCHSGSLEKSLATPSLMGMVLKPSEFQNIMLHHMGKGDLADSLHGSGIVFPESDQEEAPCDSLSKEDLDPELLKKLLPMMSGRSYLGPVVKRRLVIISISTPEKPAPQQEVESPLLSKVAAAYNWYRREQMKLAADATDIVMQHPELHRRVFDIEDSDMFKEAALPRGAAPLMLGSVPLSLMYSAHLRRKRQMGEPMGMVRGAIANHPWLTSLGVVGGLRGMLNTPTGRQVASGAADVGKAVWKGSKTAPAV